MTRRVLTLSLFAAGLFVVAAVGQPPTGGKGDGKKAEAKKADAPAPDTAIETALAHDPDVRTARAKIQLAEAELAKARQAVTAKVLTLRSAIADQKKAVVTAEESFVLANEAFKRGTGARGEMLVAREKLEAAQSALARSETELKLITGGTAVPARHAGFLNMVGMKDVSNCAGCHTAQVGLERLGITLEMAGGSPHSVALAHLGLQATKPTTGPVAERIRAALDQPVRLGGKGDKVPFDKALEMFRAAGLDVPVRPLPSPLPVVVTDGEELPIGAWFQLYQDIAAEKNEGFAFYVREYGLLVANKQTAPPDAPTLTEFWKQPKPTEKKK